MPDVIRVADEYYVRASSALADDRTRVLKYGDTFAVFNRYGDIEAFGRSQFGLFHAESRHLSRFTLQLDHQQPLLLSSTIREDNAFLSVDLTNAAGAPHRPETFPQGTLHTLRLQFLREASFYQHIRLLNHGLEPISVSLLFQFDADFADIFEVRGTERSSRGERLPDRIDGGAAVLSYEGLDGVLRRTYVEFTPRPASLTPQEAGFQITLEPHEEKSLFSTVSCERNATMGARISFPAAFDRLEQEARREDGDQCRVTTSRDSFNGWLARSSADLRMLVQGNPEGPYPYAGVPWFSTVFGRDGIITALECLWMAPEFAEGVLKYLSQTQATAEVPEQDAEPGKILHEMRRSEMAATGEVPFARYYGSVDATPLFVMLAGSYFVRTGNLSFVEEIWPSVKRALRWIDDFGDRDSDGFVEYEKRSPKGLAQQGWKDSHDSVFHADGRLAEPPIALCEVQAYVYAAKRYASRIAGALQDPEAADRLDREAEALRTKFEGAFWCEDLGTYALALDGQKHPCRVTTSNAGHALFCRIAREDRARAVAASLMSESSFSGWGIRTVGANESRYNPMSYHNGSVWPHDNALIGMGFSHYGLQDSAGSLLWGLHDASRNIELQRLPELFCGFHRRPQGGGPTLYPVACAPQAWAAGAVFLLLQACLGLKIRAQEREICVMRPYLPLSLNEVQIENLKVGDAVADLAICREESRTIIKVLRQEGELDIRDAR